MAPKLSVEARLAEEPFERSLARPQSEVQEAVTMKGAVAVDQQ